ncbi:MAG TPA: hypothetical protein VGL42_08375 [Opitutaceae bacterium]|jgi:hypothetical protein
MPPSLQFAAIVPDVANSVLLLTLGLGSLVFLARSRKKSGPKIAAPLIVKDDPAAVRRS